PVIEGGRLVAVSVACFFWRPADPVPAEVKLRDGDKISVEWKPVKGGEWTSLYTATNLNTRKGFDTITTPAFYPVEDFQLRFAVQSTGPKKDDDLPTYASISGIRVGTLCKPISSEPVVSQIMNDRATLSWEDEDNSPRAEEYHIRYKQENNTWTGWIAKNRNYTVTRLQDNTYYAMEVAAVCAGDTSDYVNVSFNTLHGLPYEFVADDAAEITFKTGALPVSGTASLTTPDANKSVWAPTAKGSDTYAGLEVDANTNNPLWFNLPVLSTGVSKGKAIFSLKLSAWDATGNQQASFGQNDTLLVLLSTTNTFDRSNTKLQINLSEVTPEGKMFDIDFDVENPYQYWAIYTNLQTAGNVLFIDSLKIEWGEINCNAVTNVRHSNVGYYSVDIAWNGEAEEYGIFYNDRTTSKWDTVYTHETSHTLENLTSETKYQYYI
ncbi:MAG: fibronectin type III domain-containing protein, partial [Bacteroidales bacterium]|nr:fibronectin type III domain-containing protein [Bacteroidales bacterium]